jgi:uncharacterized protein (DUF983 family)
MASKRYITPLEEKIYASDTSRCVCPQCGRKKQFFARYGQTQGLACLGCCAKLNREESEDTGNRAYLISALVR